MNPKYIIILSLLLVLPMAAQAACLEKCNLECVNNASNFASCYAVCRARCQDDYRAAPDKAHQVKPPDEQYAALALSPTSLQYGYAFGKASQEEAKAAALESCAQAVGTANDCAVQLWFHNACGSLALKRNNGKPGGVWGTDWATDKVKVTQRALKVCQEIAGDGCRTEVTFCASQ